MLIIRLVKDPVQLGCFRGIFKGDLGYFQVIHPRIVDWSVTAPVNNPGMNDLEISQIYANHPGKYPEIPLKWSCLNINLNLRDLCNNIMCFHFLSAVES